MWTFKPFVFKCYTVYRFRSIPYILTFIVQCSCSHYTRNQFSFFSLCFWSCFTSIYIFTALRSTLISHMVEQSAVHQQHLQKLFIDTFSCIMLRITISLYMCQVTIKAYSVLYLESKTDKRTKLEP